MHKRKPPADPRKVRAALKAMRDDRAAIVREVKNPKSDALKSGEGQPKTGAVTGGTLPLNAAGFQRERVKGPPEQKPHGPVSERFMRHHYGPNGMEQNAVARAPDTARSGRGPISPATPARGSCKYCGLVEQLSNKAPICCAAGYDSWAAAQFCLTTIDQET